MTTFTLTTNKNFDECSGKVGGDDYTVNGPILTIDTDTRYCCSSQAKTGVLGAVTLSSTLGGTLFIDGRNVRLIPFKSGTGNVPAKGATITLAGGTPTIEFTSIFSSNLNTRPSMTGSTSIPCAMPTTGYIKGKNKTGGYFASGPTVGTSGSWLNGIGAYCIGEDITGWIEVIGEEVHTITCPGLGTVKMSGAWYSSCANWMASGTRLKTNGQSGQKIQLPASVKHTYYAGAWIETAPYSESYEFFPNAGWSTTQFPGNKDPRGKVIWISSNGILSICSGSTMIGYGGYLPSTGCRVRVPNVLLQNTKSTA